MGKDNNWPNVATPRKNPSCWSGSLKISEKNLFSLKLTKMAVNAAEDNAGRVSTNQTAFALHHLLHTHFKLTSGMGMDPEFMRNFGKKGK